MPHIVEYSARKTLHHVLSMLRKYHRTFSIWENGDSQQSFNCECWVSKDFFFSFLSTVVLECKTMEKYYELIEFLNEARIVYSELLIQIGTVHMKRNPLSNPEEFLELYSVPRNEILEILNEKKLLISHNNRGTKTKTKRKSRSNFHFHYCISFIL